VFSTNTQYVNRLLGVCSTYVGENMNSFLGAFSTNAGYWIALKAV